MKSLFAVMILPAMGLHSDPAYAQKFKLRADRVQIEYVPPKNPDHEPIFRLMKERQVLEKFKEFLSPLRLPRALRLNDAEGYCDGDRASPTLNA